MKTFQDYLNEKVDTLDTLHDPGIRSYYSRHRVTPGNRKDFETLRKIMMVTLEAGPTARRRLGMLLHQLAATTVPEIKPLVSQLGIFTAQDARDAKKLFDPQDIQRDLMGSKPGEDDDEEVGDDTTPQEDDIMKQTMDSDDDDDSKSPNQPPF
jgi:hypothetical protein